MSIPIATLGAEGTEVVDGLERLHGPVIVVRRCAELPELIAVCQSGLASVALVARGTASITATLGDRLAEVGVGVVGLTDDDGERLRLAGLGVPSAPQGIGPADLARLIAEVANSIEEAPRGGVGPSSSFSLAGPSPFAKPAIGPESRTESPVSGARTGHADIEESAASGEGAPGEGMPSEGMPGEPAWGEITWGEGAPGEGAPGDGPADPGGRSGSPGVGSPSSAADAGGRSGRGGETTAPDSAAPGSRADDAAETGRGATSTAGAHPAWAESGAPRGSLIAVWGPIGSPGRTTIAVNVAGELAAVGERVVLVDADTFGPGVAVHLGLLDESAGIAQACRLADQGTLDAEALVRVASTVVTSAGTLLVLTGLTRADRWPELRAASFAAVLARCREIADTVVVDAGFSLEADEELSFDTMAPRRNAATLRALEQADRVLAVGAADAVGMPRLVRGLTELERAVPDAAPDIVFNKIRRGALGRFPERALREAWERFGPERSIAALVPYDADAADAALLGGHLLLESAPQSALRRAIADVVCSPVQHNRKSAVASARALAKRSR